MNMLPSTLEACEYRMQTTKLLNSYITEMAENSISERLIFKIFWGGGGGGACPQTPLQEKTLKRRFKFSPLTYQLDCDYVTKYVTHSEAIFKTG